MTNRFKSNLIISGLVGNLWRGVARYGRAWLRALVIDSLVELPEVIMKLDGAKVTG